MRAGQFPARPDALAQQQGNVFRLDRLKAPSEVELPSPLTVLRDITQQVGHAELVGNQDLLNRRVSGHDRRPHDANNRVPLERKDRR